MYVYYLCEFEYGYSGQFYQRVSSEGIVDGYFTLTGDALILEGAYGYRVINPNPVTPDWAQQ